MLDSNGDEGASTGAGIPSGTGKTVGENIGDWMKWKFQPAGIGTDPGHPFDRAQAEDLFKAIYVLKKFYDGVISPIKGAGQGGPMPGIVPEGILKPPEAQTIPENAPGS